MSIILSPCSDVTTAQARGSTSANGICDDEVETGWEEKVSSHTHMPPWLLVLRCSKVALSGNAQAQQAGTMGGNVVQLFIPDYVRSLMGWCKGGIFGC